MRRTTRIETTKDYGSFLAGPLSTGQPSVLTTEQADALFAAHGKTFYFAARFFPGAYRSAIVALYAFFRTLDDLVDERPAGWRPDPVRQEVEAWQSWFRAGSCARAPREPLGTDLAAVLHTYQIPSVLFGDFLCGLLTDLEPRVFRDFPELSRYCYQVAGTVGLALAHLLGARSPQALEAARHLGIAMQLTNILRDVGSDLAAGRIYFPQDELASFGLSASRLYQLYQERQGPDDAFRALMRYQIRRARLSYMAGLPGSWLLPRECRFPILLAGRLYQRILTLIERRDYDVLRGRASTSLFTKIQEAGVVFLLASLWQYGEAKLLTEVDVRYEH